MKEKLLQLLQQGSAYAVANVLFKVAGFFLAFIYLDPQYLTVAANGEREILLITTQIAAALFGLGLSNGLLKFWAESEEEGARDALAFTTMLAVAVLAAAAAAVLWTAARPLAGLFLGDPARAPLMRLVAAYVALMMASEVPKEMIRIYERVWLYVLATAGEMVLLVGGFYYFLVAQGLGLRGVFYAHVLAAGLSTLVLTAGLLRTVRWRVEWRFAGRLARFGMPLALAGLAYLFLDAGDRYLLGWLASDATVGVYGWAARVGGVLNILIVRSFRAAFRITGVKELGGQTQEADLHRRVFRHFSIWGAWAVLGLSLAAYDLTLLIAESPAYLAAGTLVFPIALGFFFYGIYYLMVNILYAGGQTKTIAWGILAAALFNAACNAALIPALGAMGAALATALAYLVLVLLTLRVTRRATETAFPWGTLLRALLLAGALFALGLLSTDWPAPARLAWRAALVVLYLPLIPAVRLYSWAEVKEIARYLRERAAKS